MQIDTIRIAARMRATGGALAAGRDVWRDSGAVKTQVFVAQSDYAIEVRDTHLHCRSSAPIGRAASRIAGRSMFGEAWQGVHHGYGVWSVVRGASEIHRRVGVLDFQWLLQDADKVTVEFTDRDGNVGGWATHTASVTGTIDRHQYVDTAGNDANDGLTTGTAVATAYRARLNMESALMDNEVGAIHYRRGQVHTYTVSTLPWQGHVAGIRRRCIFDGYDVGADPIIRGDGSSAAAFSYGNLDSIELHGLRLEGERIADVESVGVSCLRTAGTRGPQNLLIRDCTLTDHRTCIILQDSHMTQAQRLTGGGDFVCLWRTSLTEAGAFHLFDSLGSRYVSMTDCTLTKTYGESGVNTTRVSNWLHYVMHNTTWSPENGGSMRLQCGRDTTVGKDIGESGYGSITDCTFVGTDRQFSAWGFGRPAPDDSSEGWLHDVRMLNLRTEECRFALGVGTFGQTAGNNQYDRIQLWSCTIGGPIDLMGGPASGRLNSFEAIDCAVVMSGELVGEAYEGPAPAVRLYGREAARYASGSVKLRGLRAQWPAESAGFQRVMFNAPRLTQAQLVPIIDSDYVHASNVGAPSPTWVDGGLNLIPEFTLQYELTLAQWQSATTNDDNSTTRGSSNLNVVSLGTHSLNQSDMDARYVSAGGVVDNLGWPRVHALDAAGKIRFSPPDPGPFEFGASAEPDGPPGVLPIRTADSSAFLQLASESSATVAASGPLANGVAELSLRTTGTGDVVSGSDAEALLSLAVAGSLVSTNDAEGAAVLRLSVESSAADSASADVTFISARGVSSLGFIGGGGAAVTLVGNAGAIFSLAGFGVAEGLRASADGVAALSLAGAASGTISTNAPVFGCKITNTSAHRFVGWWHVNTDMPVSEAYGQRNGTTFVRGEPSGVDTRMVSVLVDLAAGATLELPDFVADTTTPPAVPTVPSNFFGGDPAINGVAMTLSSNITDGQATVSEWRYRSGVWQVYLWTTWVPGEPWARCEVLVLHSNPTSASLRENWPGWALTWGTGTVQALGRAADGSLVASGRGFGDGQCQPRPVLAWWPGRYRDAQDATNVAAQTDWLVMGHAIQNQLHDGTPLERTGSAAWAASTIAGHLARLDNWDEDSGSIRKQAGPPGNQGDHMFVREEPRYYVNATRSAYIAAMRWGAKPCHHVEVDGRYIDLVARPTLRMFDGRPHPPTTGDMLGKPGPINPAVHSEDWDGPGMEHDLTNGLDAATRYTGSRALSWILGAKANLYLGSRFPPGFGSNSALFSTRGLFIEAANAVHIYRDLRDRTLATAIRDRVRVRATGVFAPWIYPTHGFPPEYWQVYTSPTASVPEVPAYIPWQQGPCAYFLDLANRVFGGLDGLAAGVIAGAYQVLDDVWSFEFSPTFGVERWVEYERIQLPKPYGLGIRGRDGTWATAFLPPTIALIRRLEPSNAKANKIWAQMIAQLGGGGTWLPPSGAAAAVDSARGSAVIGLAGSGSAIVESGEAVAAGVAAIGLAGEGTAELGPIVPAARGAGMLALFGEGYATDAEPRGGPGRNFRRPYWLWLWRSFRR